SSLRRSLRWFRPGFADPKRPPSNAPFPAQPLHAHLVLGVEDAEDEAGDHVLELPADERDVDADRHVDLLGHVVTVLPERERALHLPGLARNRDMDDRGRRPGPRLVLAEADLVAEELLGGRGDALGAVGLLDLDLGPVALRRDLAGEV